MERPSRMAFEPSPNIGKLVGGVVVDDGVDHLAGGNLLADDIEARNKLLRALALHLAGARRAVEDVHRGEQRRRAVALISCVMVPARPFFNGSPGCVRSSA